MLVDVVSRQTFEHVFGQDADRANGAQEGRIDLLQAIRDGVIIRRDDFADSVPADAPANVDPRHHDHRVRELHIRGRERRLIVPADVLTQFERIGQTIG